MPAGAWPCPARRQPRIAGAARGANHLPPAQGAQSDALRGGDGGAGAAGLRSSERDEA